MPNIVLLIRQPGKLHCMIAHQLDIAVHETIQAHAAHYSDGKLDVQKILSAIGEIAASYLAEIPQFDERKLHFNQLCYGIAQATNMKAIGSAVPIKS